ncbi:hypothetical protein OsI_31895 [Oryza sativa Indica Group]|uniref:Uncharacterized protein n=1 Tax=Oryza sativa subsp. indica TaxID=39946 RepID=A2Z2Q0_ORYSI|nr:hypothetical protein OsI_31895 [Oryza sativa Indica Group]
MGLLHDAPSRGGAGGGKLSLLASVGLAGAGGGGSGGVGGGGGGGGGGGYKELLVMALPKDDDLDAGKVADVLGFRLPDVEGAVRAFFRSREVREFASGALAGAMSKAVLAPLETIRTRMVVGVGSRHIGGSFVEIIEQNGWQGLWAVAVAGAAAGIAGTLVCHPLEVIKDRLTINREVYPSISVAFSKIYRTDGIRGLYAGLCPTLIGMLPYSTCYYFMYDTIKTSYCRLHKKTSLTRPELLVIGALSGLTASTISFPLEVARKRLMVGALQGKCPPHMIAALAEVIQEEGLPGLYRGWGASCLKVMPNSGITWMFYEACKDILLADKDKRKA